MNGCGKIGESLSAYLDGELTQQDRQLVEVHVEGCRRCRSTLKELSRIREGIGQLDPPQPSKEQWSKMMSLGISRTSRGFGWLLGIGGSLLLVGYGAYEFATDETTEALVKIGVAGGAGGVLLLLVSVLTDRLRARKTDKYKDVEL